MSSIELHTLVLTGQRVRERGVDRENLSRDVKQQRDNLKDCNNIKGDVDVN